jgi:predicted nucleic acid-binding protein
VKVLVDSDILIEISRRRNEYVWAQWAELSNSEDSILYSPVSSAEVWSGSRPNEYESTGLMFQLLACAPIDAEIGRKAGEYLREFRKSHTLKLGDALIAATAAQIGAHLWTRNRKHFPMKDLSFY